MNCSEPAHRQQESTRMADAAIPIIGLVPGVLAIASKTQACKEWHFRCRRHQARIHPSSNHRVAWTELRGTQFVCWARRLVGCHTAGGTKAVGRRAP
jgi:hypothetical protein